MSEEHIDVFDEDVADGLYKDSIAGYIPNFEENDVPDKKIEETPPPTPEIPIFNTKPLTQEETTYRLEKFEKKILYIFNHVYVAGYDKRKGSEKDERKLQEVFEKLGFELKCCPDFTLKEIIKVLNEMKSKDFSDYGCVGMVIMTHGHKDGKLMAADRPYVDGDVLKYFKSNVNPSLVTKPKFLFIQACRGRDASESIQVLSDGPSKLRKDHAEEVRPYTLPVESDILVLHSSYYGKYSLRHEEEGSWFIQTLCEKIEQHHKERHLEEILKLVTREIANKEFVIKNKITYEPQIEKQMPIMTTTLTRDLYLKKYELNNSESDQKVLNDDEDDAVNKLESQQDYQRCNVRDDQTQNETENNVQKDEMVDPKLTCQCNRVRTNYLNYKYAYVKHNTQLYMTQNYDMSAVKLFESVQTLEGDDRFQMDQLSNMLEPLIKNKVIFCRECNTDTTFKFN